VPPATSTAVNVPEELNVATLAPLYWNTNVVPDWNIAKLAVDTAETPAQTLSPRKYVVEFAVPELPRRPTATVPEARLEALIVVKLAPEPLNKVAVTLVAVTLVAVTLVADRLPLTVKSPEVPESPE
jgi:hypothetical protein